GRPSYFPFFRPDDPLISLYSKTTMTSKGKAQENMGKESLAHLSALRPTKTDNPTEMTTSVDRPA
ncbi:MAG: hypothetical protein Q8932_18115, partial [Bacteroidota bacterium]|nr:hypothetical protein [Bacteroidota bacterium]